MRRRTFMLASAAAMLAHATVESRAQRTEDTGTGEVNFLVTQHVVDPGKEAEFEALLREMEAATVANDKGCLRFEWYRAETPQTYILVERWTDLAAVQAHLKAPHMVAIREKTRPLVPGQSKFVRLTKL